MANADLERDPFYLRYYTGHQGMHGHEFLEFEYAHGRIRYANNSNYRNDSLIRKEMFVSPIVVDEMKRIIRESEITKEDDVAWPKKNIVGRQELEVRIEKEHISFETAKIGSLADVNESADAEGLRVFYYLVQDLKRESKLELLIMSFRIIQPLASTSRLFKRNLASHAYIPPSIHPSTSSNSHSESALAAAGPSTSNPAVTTTPDLTPAQHDTISRIIRVDQAGELGANWIYRGQKWAMGVRGDKETEREVEEMWETERHHLATAHLLSIQHRVRPTALYPLWQGMAFALGAGTGLMGREAAMACTEAVETVIGEHYDDQLKTLEPLIKELPHPSLPLLRDVLTEFRDDELEHLDAAVAGGAQKAPGHSLLSAIIGMGCKAAIKVCERV